MNVRERYPAVGDIVKLTGEQCDTEDFKLGRVLEVYLDKDLGTWWETSSGESKVALMDAIEAYGTEKAAEAEWYVVVANVAYPSETMAVASFECELM